MSDQSDRLLNQDILARRDNRLADAKRDLVEAVALCREAGASGELARALADLDQIAFCVGKSILSSRLKSLV